MVKKSFISVFLSIFFFFTFVLILEGSFALYFHFRPLPKTLEELKLEKDYAPYQAAPYFSPQFMRDQMADFRWFTPPGTRMVIPSNMNKTFINIEENHRVTTDVPKDYDRTLYLFGGSTIFCQEVPDSLTIASFFQRWLNEHQKEIGARFRVVNLGFSGHMLYQQIQRLKQVPELKANDIVVFYDGVNDIYQKIYFNNPLGNIVDKVENEKKLDLVLKLQKKLPLFYQEHSAFFRFLNYIKHGGTPRHLMKDEEKKKIIATFIQEMTEQIEEAANYVSSKGVKFYHFTQPSIYTKKNLTTFERYILGNRYIVFQDTQLAYDLGHEAYHAIHNNLEKKQIFDRDISSLFNQVNGEIFLDPVHVNHLGNYFVAQTLINNIFPQLVDSSPPPDFYKLWAQFDEVKKQRKILREDKISGELAGNIKNERGEFNWYISGDKVEKSSSMAKGVSTNQLFFELNIPPTTQRMETLFKTTLTNPKGLIIYDLVWKGEDEKEISRFSDGVQGFGEKDFSLNIDNVKVPEKASKLLLILRPFTPQDGILSVKDGHISWF